METGGGNEGLNDATIYYSDTGNSDDYHIASQQYTLQRNVTLQSFLTNAPGKHQYWKLVASSGYYVNGGLNHLQFYGIKSK